MAKIIAEHFPVVKELLSFRVICREPGCDTYRETDPLVTKEQALARAVGHHELRNHHVVVEDTREA